MEFTTGAQDLLAALGHLQNVTGSTSVFLSTEPPHAVALWFGAAAFAPWDDGDLLWVSARVPALVRRSGRLLLDVESLTEALRSTSSDDVTISFGEGRALARAGAHAARRTADEIVLSQARGGQEPPTVCAADWIHVEAMALHRLVRMTRHSISTDDTRPHHASALLERCGERLRMSTTDGYHLSQATVHMGSAGHVLRMLLPRRALVVLERSLELPELGPSEVGVAGAGDHALFQWADFRIVIPLTQAEPVLLPDDSWPSPEQRLVVERTKLVDAIEDLLERTTLPRSDEPSRTRRLELDVDEGTLTISRDAVDPNDRETIEVAYDGDSMRLHLDGYFLLDAVRAIDDVAISIGLGRPIDPVVLESGRASAVAFRSIIMPMAKNEKEAPDDERLDAILDAFETVSGDDGQEWTELDQELSSEWFLPATGQPFDVSALAGTGDRPRIFEIRAPESLLHLLPPRLPLFAAPTRQAPRGRDLLGWAVVCQEERLIVIINGNGHEVGRTDRFPYWFEAQ